MTSLPLQDRATGEPPVPRKITRKPTGGDAIFVHTFRSVGASVLIITGGIGVFLALQSVPTLRHYGPGFFSVHEGWNFDTDQVSVASLLVGTVEVALIAISIAFPLALATALYISEYAPPKLQATLVSAIDLMAAVPVDRLRALGSRPDPAACQLRRDVRRPPRRPVGCARHRADVPAGPDDHQRGDLDRVAVGR